MDTRAHAFVTGSVKSFEAGFETGKEITDAFRHARLSALLCYATVNHDQAALLRGLREAVGRDVAVLGCSTQGLVTRGRVVEQGYAVGGLGLGGDTLRAAAASVEDIHLDTAAKGAALGRALTASKDEPLKAVVLLYDPLCGADMNVLLAALFEEVRCPIIGGGAGQVWGPMVRTYQYFGDRVLGSSAVALGLSGPFAALMAVCHGSSPVGIEMTVTKAEGNRLLELDGRPALDIWEEICGANVSTMTVENTAALAIAIPAAGGSSFVRAAFGIDAEKRGLVLQAGLPTGTRIMLHHRTVRGVLEGTAEMGRRLADQIRGKRVCAVLGFECGGRTQPFLGTEGTLAENLDLQKAIGIEAEWLGMMAWGEVFPYGAKPEFQNYAYPMLVLAE